VELGRCQTGYVYTVCVLCACNTVHVCVYVCMYHSIVDVRITVCVSVPGTYYKQYSVYSTAQQSSMSHIPG